MRAILLGSVVLGLSVAGCSGGTTDTGDAGQTFDTGSSTDASHAVDSGRTVDANVDAGHANDAASTTDGGRDAASTADAGNDAASIDAAVAIDSATDAGATCTSDTDCAAGTEYCHTPDGMCGGTGVCDPSGGLCSGVFTPVCGCNGTTYSNAGCAQTAGQSISHAGACGAMTGCTMDSDCTGTQFCDLAPGVCGGTGSCVSRGIGRFCIATCAPECGCDGTTYQNACHRQQAGTSLDTTGTCPGDVPPCTTAGCCRADGDCASTEECVSTPAGGVCKTKVSRPMCWRDADCNGGRTCMGAGVCPCGASCFVADHPGTCG